MDISLIMKITGIGMLTAAAYQILARAGREDQAVLISIAGSVVVLFIISERVGELFDSIRTIFGL